jgi:hypothetical protein
MSFNYKNVKFAVDHLTFKKVINSILEILTTIKNKITNLSESIGEQIFSNNVLVLDESNWDQYITPRPKIVGLAGDNIKDYSIANNPFNQETCYYIAIERDKYVYHNKVNVNSDYLTENYVSSNYGNNFIKNVVEPDNTDYESGSCEKDGINFFNDFKSCTDNTIINNAVSNSKFVKIARARLKVPKKYKTIQFNFKYISFLGLTIVPEGFVENSEDTDSETNKNKQLNGTEINIFQLPTSGVDVSSFRTPKNSDKELIIKERVVSLNNNESKLGTFKSGAKIIYENGIDSGGYTSATLNTYNVKIKLVEREDGTIYSSTNDDDDTYQNLPKKLLTYPNWGGIYSDSVSQNYAYSKYNESTHFTNFDNLIQFHYYTTPTNDKLHFKHEEISGTYLEKDSSSDSSTFPSSGSLKRLKPGRETKLIWYNGFWFYC